MTKNNETIKEQVIALRDKLTTQMKRQKIEQMTDDAMNTKEFIGFMNQSEAILAELEKILTTKE